MSSLAFGAIADDITGASDLANTLVRGGLSTILAIGTPEAEVADVEAVVIALKTRTIAAADAVSQSLAAYRWLAARPAGAMMVKYCSTFDSTADGNIGPVVDAVLDASGGKLSIVCPAFPTTKRTVYKGHLFVGDVPLNESSMRDHPLTPMRDSSLVRLMGSQTRHPVILVPWETVAEGAAAVAAALDAAIAGGARHVVVDAITDQDLRVIAEAAQGRALLTGGSGIAIGVPQLYGASGGSGYSVDFSDVEGASFVVAGSCSAATNGQVAAFQATGAPAYHLDPLCLADDPASLVEAFNWVREHLGRRPILIYSTAQPEALRAAQARIGAERAASLVEHALARITAEAVDAGARRIVVAGGETSGAVMHALGVRLLRIGPEIDPGVPWTRTLGEKALALALKSGNFGRPDFFTRAFEVLP
jgi:3-dehydrotetronate 4-kinase